MLGSGTETRSIASLRVRQLMRNLSTRLNTQDGCRIAIGLIYLRNTARAQPADIWGRSEKPSWSWLVAQTGKSNTLGPDLRWCLSEWLPRGLGPDSTDVGEDFVPRLPPTVDGLLRELVRAVDEVDRVGDLLEQCLEDLSAAQAKGGHYFTPRDIVRLMVTAAAPQGGQRVFDPVCGSAGLLVDADRHVREQTGLQPNLALTGRDLHAGTLQIAQMNLAARGLRADLGVPVDSLAQPSSATYDIVLANPPFNMTPWYDGTPGVGDPRWSDSPPPPRDNANFAWILHVAHALAPQGRAALLMADGAATGARRGEQRIRERLVRDDLVECVVALPPGLFPHTRISSCLWLLNRDKSPHRGWGNTDRRGDVLFIDATSSYESVSGTRQRRLAADGVGRILRTLAAWRGAASPVADAGADYADVPDWCVSRSAEEIGGPEYGLLPTVHASAHGDEGTTALQRVDELKWKLYADFEEAHALERDLRLILDEL
jgi:type I restriction enzyme M protein